jgi:hypothetical protein
LARSYRMGLTRLYLGDCYRTYPTTVEDEVRSVLARPEDFIRGPLPLRRDSAARLGVGFTVRDGHFGTVAERRASLCLRVRDDDRLTALAPRGPGQPGHRGHLGLHALGTVCVHHPSRPGGDHHGDIGREPRLATEQRADEGDGASINAGHLALAWTANRQRDAVAECGAPPLEGFFIASPGVEDRTS